MRFDFRTVTRTVAVGVPIVAGLLLGRLVSPWLPEFSAWVHTLGMWAPLAFVGAYIVVVVLMLPAFLLIMAGGAVFGVVQGSVLVMCGAVAGGTVAFLIGRHLARSFVERRMSRHPTLAAFDKVIGEDGLRLVLLLRLSPAVPFVLSNYALGVTRVRLRDFVVGTLGLAPIVVTYAAYGSASGSGARPDGSAAVSPLLLTLGFVTTIVLGARLARMVQQAFRDAELVTAQGAAESGVVATAVAAEVK